MSDRRSGRIETLFNAATQLDPSERARYLQEACGDDRDLRAEVESLLEFDRPDSSFVSPVVRPESFAAVAASLESADMPKRLGKYTVVRLIGEGGMGAVYEAEQESPRRTVALKVIRPELTSPQMLRRFEHEAQVLANLDHPGIAHVYEAGVARVDTSHGQIRRPFFAMELVSGAALDDYGRTHELSTRQRLELIAAVCDAIHHAHQKGVIHRDLKPGNILVNERGEPKVLDFGVARMTDADIRATTIQTGAGQLIGTVPYMSPEQVAGDSRALDVRSDVYALGVVMFELLTGNLPLAVSHRTLPEAVRIIKEETPTRIGAVDTTYRGDVETIVGTALEKDRERRYQSAAALADDIRRYLDHQPIVARPPSVAYQMRLFARRHRVAVGAAALVLIALIAATIVSSVFAVRARREATDRAHQQLVAERISSHLAYLLRGPDPARLGGGTTMAEMLDALSARLDDEGESLPEVEAEVRETIAATYWYLQRYDDAADEFDKAAAAWRSINPMHPRLPETLADLGKACGNAERYEQAEAAFREALLVLGADPEAGVFPPPPEAESLRRFGHDPGIEADALRIAGRLATLLIHLERYDEAEPIGIGVVEEMSRAPERDPVGLTMTLRRLARIRSGMNDPESAAAYYRRATEVADAHIDGAHPIVAGVYFNLGSTLAILDDDDGTRDAFARAWTLASTARPVGSGDWMSSYATYRDCLIEQGRRDEAIAVVESARDMLEAAHGVDDERAVAARRQLAELREESGESN